MSVRISIAIVICAVSVLEAQAQKRQEKNAGTIVGDTLKEVIVTAREAGGMTSSSRISRSAMEHLQPTSFTDLLELLPGNISKDPGMGAVTHFAARNRHAWRHGDEDLQCRLQHIIARNPVPCRRRTYKRRCKHAGNTKCCKRCNLARILKRHD